MSLTINTVETMEKSEELKELIAQYHLRKSELDEITPKVDAIYNKVLEKYNFIDEREKTKITDYEQLYLSLEDHDGYYSEVDGEFIASNLMHGVEEGHCPKLTKKRNVIMIKNRIIDYVIETCEFPKVYDMEIRDALFHITLKFISKRG